ncbi:helix-turn-helix transcriptional regulator [Acanthopleuribacter pedis]|uniref:Helix-turn-helix domain-containing protein n=1 Tax=Acanthopleuribacter pedis TaxID=442870 RepID=A0A8J7QBX3_9BACT|nr:helix-turn-helix transcriptional regulator [Acanthopleuribacter pedis]MBO1323302.1 helix-turn-helix domain-containing protein [Acanthopleuribacter pedis]
MDNDLIRLILGMKVRRLRQQAHFSLQDLAKKTGMSASYLNEIEKGKKYPKAEKIMSLADALSVGYDDLVSLRLEEDLGNLTPVLNSPLIQKFPFKLFGISAQDLIQLMARVPREMGILAKVLEDMGHNYDMRVEHFFHTALRSFQIINHNFFADIEKTADRFRKTRGWEADRIVGFDELLPVLKEEFGVTINLDCLADHPTLSHMRSVLTEDNQLLLHHALSQPRQAFAIGREIGYRLLKAEERAYSSPPLEVGTFEEVFNNFKASYFASAILLPRERLFRDLKSFFKLSFWDAEAFRNLMAGYKVTPETFFYRLSQLVPHYFRSKRVHFLKFERGAGESRAKLVKQLNMSNVHIPHGIGLKEQFCRRWLSLYVIDELEAEPEKDMVIGVQRSRFIEHDSEFFCISVAFRGMLDPNHYSSLTLGFQVDAALRKTVRFLPDPKVPHRELGQTCERCPLTAEHCQERVTEPTLYLEKKRRAEQLSALKQLRAGVSTAATTR